MLEDLVKTDRRVAGTRQVLRLIKADRVCEVFLALDAAESIREEVTQTASAHNLPVVMVQSMAQLGKQCKLQVPSAVAAVLRDTLI